MTRTLLVVDDNKSVRDSLRFLLERRGYNVLLAENGPDALELARAHAIDGAMIDVQMPGMSGLKVCRTLATEGAPTGRSIAIWMMTGGRSPELTKASLDAGALALLGKPFDFADLFQRFDQQFHDTAGDAAVVPAAPDGPAAAPQPPPGAPFA